jgi:hypothetical protein
MLSNRNYVSMPFVQGDVLALLSKIDDIEPGLYVLTSMTGDWAVLRLLIDDERAERLYVTKTEITLPARLLLLFQSVGLRLGPHEQLEH